MKEQTFSGASLEEALREGTLTRSQAAITGMVKPAEKKGHIGFARGGCDSWVDLPADVIEEAEQIGQRACREHSHPIMRITLKEPEDATGKILLALLLQSEESPQIEGLNASARLPARIQESQSAELFGAPEFRGRSLEELTFRSDGGASERGGPQTSFVTRHRATSPGGTSNLIKVKWKCRPCRRCFRWNSDWCFDDICCEITDIEIDI